MPENIYIGNQFKGLVNAYEAFNIDNTAFPVLFNFYAWRGRVKKKRGTSTLARLRRQIELDATPENWQYDPITLTAGDLGNLLTQIEASPTPTAITNITLGDPTILEIIGHDFEVGETVQILDVGGTTELNFNFYTITALTNNTISIDIDSILFTPYTANGQAYLACGPSIQPGSVTLVTGGETFTEPATPDGTLEGDMGGTGTIYYNTGAFFLDGYGGGTVTGSFNYFPSLPVLGLREYFLAISTSDFPRVVAFDTTYAYQAVQNTPSRFFSISYYKHSNNPVTWSNGDFAQFWSINYENALWVTNGKSGFHFVNATYVSGSGTTDITFTFLSAGNPYETLVVGDRLWFNEWAAAPDINRITGEVITVVNAAAGQYEVQFASNVTVAGNGIAQLLTSSIEGQDGIRFYDGDMTNQSGIPVTTTNGWVNFAPPLTEDADTIFDQTADIYYLVGALIIEKFKDRLLFFGPQIQSVGGTVIQKSIQDTVVFSWNGTPYYNEVVPDTLPDTSTFDVEAYYVNKAGRGGYQPAGTAQPVLVVNNNDDVLLVGFGGTGTKANLVYTQNDLQPFQFYLINGELPSNCTFSAISMDVGGVEVGQYGITITNQNRVERFDNQIPDEIFNIQRIQNGFKRVNAIRDFYREWLYFAYPIGGGTEASGTWRFPTQTLLYNYIEQTWAPLRENFTSHGTFNKTTSYTWATLPFATWAEWREPWNAGFLNAEFPSIIAGNPQGFVIIKDEGTGEAPTGYISAVQNDGKGNTLITCCDHCLNSQISVQGINGDYLYFTQGLEVPYLNGQIGLVIDTIDADHFVVDIAYPTTTTITNVFLTNPCVIQGLNNYVVGQKVTITDVVGTTELNGNSYEVVSSNGVTFGLDVNATGFTPYVSGGVSTPVPYQGVGKFTRLIQPSVFTKQFNPYWQEGKKTRLGVQKYLFDTTANSQVTANISLNQDDDTIYNRDPVYPDVDAPNRSVMYQQTVYTCPELSNLGLSAQSLNLMQLGAVSQNQIWHRMNTSLIGDTVQVGITLNDAQMRNLEYATSDITLQGIILTVYPAGDLA